MKNVLEHYLKKIFPGLVVIAAFIFAASLPFIISPQREKNNQLVKTPTPTIEKDLQRIEITPSPTPTSSPKKVMGAKTSYSPPTATLTPNKNNETNNINTTTQSSNTSFQQQASSQTTPQSPTPTSTPPVVTEVVNVEIQTPDATSSFSVVINNNMNVCDIMQKAKDEGKINSLTIDDEYLMSLNSKYVSEINGYKNNWTFKINGDSPLGCSLSTPKPNDTIVWKFG